MEAPTRIVLLLVGFGVGEILAEEPTAEEKRASPLFVVPVVVVPAAPVRPDPTPVSRELAALIRREVGAAPVGDAGDADAGPVVSESGVLQLEKLTVMGKKLLTPAQRESAIDKFTRTGHLWEFSPTKRIMIGPNGDKVGLMFSWDW